MMGQKSDGEAWLAINEHCVMYLKVGGPGAQKESSKKGNDAEHELLELSGMVQLRPAVALYPEI